MLVLSLVLSQAVPRLERRRGSEAGSYLRLIDSGITHLRAEGSSRTCNKRSREEETSLESAHVRSATPLSSRFVRKPLQSTRPGNPEPPIPELEDILKVIPTLKVDPSLKVNPSPNVNPNDESEPE